MWIKLIQYETYTISYQSYDLDSHKHFTLEKMQSKGNEISRH